MFLDWLVSAIVALLAAPVDAPLQATHTTLTDATQHCAEGARTADEAIEGGNVLGLYAAAQLITACAEGLGEWSAEVDALRN